MYKVRFVWNGKEMEGILIKKEGDVYYIKLSNGYNVGLRNIEIIEKEEYVLDRSRKDETISSDILLVSTGGTISSKVDYVSGAVYPSLSPKEFLETFSLSFDVKEISSIFSEDITPYHWSLFAEAVYEAFKDYEGIILTHGTDTLHYTSSALSFSLPFEKPLALTGSQRSSDRPSSDNIVNVRTAYAFVKSKYNAVSVAFHSSIGDERGVLLRGVNVRKMHTTRRDAFKSINVPPLGYVEGGEFFVYNEWQEAKFKKGPLMNKFSDKVAIVYFYPGMREELFESYFDYDGVLILGTGMGHVSTEKGEMFKPILHKIEELIESGVAVAISSQTIFGRVNLNVYRTGRKLLEVGVWGNYSAMSPETAFVKLSWVLANEKDLKKAKQLYEGNVVGENPDRILYGGDGYWL